MPLLRTTTSTKTTRPGITGPTTPRWPTQRTTLVGNKVESTSLLPWLGVEPGQNVKRLEKFKCGSDAAERRAFEKKCRKYFNTSSNSTLESDPLEFVFRSTYSSAATLFVTVSFFVFIAAIVRTCVSSARSSPCYGAPRDTQRCCSSYFLNFLSAQHKCHHNRSKSLLHNTQCNSEHPLGTCWAHSLHIPRRAIAIFYH